MVELVPNHDFLEGDGWWDRGWRCIDWRTEDGDWIVSCTKDGHTFDSMRLERGAAKKMADVEITRRELRSAIE